MGCSRVVASVFVCTTLACTPSPPPEASTSDSPESRALDVDPEAAARAAGILGTMPPGLHGSGPIDIGDDDDVWVGLSEGEGPMPTKGAVRLAKPEVGEGLDRDAVRRVVRGHLAEIRSCYAKGLDRHPTLAGRVEIAFSIDAEGVVSTSAVHSNSLEPADDRVATCIAEASETWRFPAPTKGPSVSVVYPFALSLD